VLAGSAEIEKDDVNCLDTLQGYATGSFMNCDGEFAPCCSTREAGFGSILSSQGPTGRPARFTRHIWRRPRELRFLYGIASAADAWGKRE